MPVDMERLRIERHVGEQHVVHLRDGAGVAVLDGFARDEVLKIEAAALVPCRRLLRHSITPWTQIAMNIGPASPPTLSTNINDPECRASLPTRRKSLRNRDFLRAARAVRTGKDLW